MCWFASKCTGTKKFKKTRRLSRKKESNPGSLVQEPAVATTKPPPRPNGDGRLNHKCLYFENLNVLSLDSPGKKSTTIYFNLFFLIVCKWLQPRNKECNETDTRHGTVALQTFHFSSWENCNLCNKKFMRKMPCQINRELFSRCKLMKMSSCNY